MGERSIVVIGASAGGVEALMEICADLPPGFPASVCIVQHLSPSVDSLLPRLLSRAGPLTAATPIDGETLRRGRIYVAPPDQHMLIRPGRVILRRGPQENRSRPAVDALFRSAAVAYGAAVIGVVLTGLLDDGSEGLYAVKHAGGVAVVQDPKDAMWPSMPQHAIERDGVDHILPVSGMAALLKKLVAEPAGPSLQLPAETVAEDRLAEHDFAVAVPDRPPPGRPSSLSCPDCGGVLNAIGSTGRVRFRCQVGHAFTGLGLALAQNMELERALGVAVRTHRDRLRLFQQMEASASARGLPNAAQRWGKAAAEARRLAEVLEKAIANLRPRPESDPEIAAETVAR